MRRRQSGKTVTARKLSTMQIGVFEIPVPAKKANGDDGPKGIADGAFSAELDEALGVPADRGHSASHAVQPPEQSAAADAKPEEPNGQGVSQPVADGEGDGEGQEFQIPAAAEDGLSRAAGNAAEPALQAPPFANTEAGPATAPTPLPQAVQAAIDALAAAGPQPNSSNALPNQVADAGPASAAPLIGIPRQPAVDGTATQQPGSMRPELAALGQTLRPGHAQAPRANNQAATPQPATASPALAALAEHMAPAGAKAPVVTTVETIKAINPETTLRPEANLRPEATGEPAIRAVPATPAIPAIPAVPVDGVAVTPATPAVPAAAAVPATGRPETSPAALVAVPPDQPAARVDATDNTGAAQKPARVPSIELTGTTVIDGNEPVSPSDDGLETATAAVATAAARLAGMAEEEGQPQPRAPETAPPIIAALANTNTTANGNGNGKSTSEARGQATAKSAGGTPSANATAGPANDTAALNTAQPAQASPVREAAHMVANQHLAPGQAVAEQAQPDAAAFREALSSALPEQANPAGGLDGLRPANAAGAVPILARAAAHAPVPFADQIAFNIRQAIDNGETQIRIQLQPHELGRIDVRLEMTEAGKVTAMISAERQDTLDMLMRDSRSLEKALQEAGLDVDSNSLAFDLDQGDEDPESASQGDSSDLADGLAEGEEETDVVMPAAAILSGTPDGVDISV
jgi:flagellar hook-length control protein FliK